MQGVWVSHLGSKLDEREALGLALVVQNHPDVFHVTILQSMSATLPLQRRRDRTYRLEQSLQVLLGDELAEAGDVYLALIRIAVRALFPSLRVRDVHREPAAFLHVSTVKLQRVLC